MDAIGLKTEHKGPNKNAKKSPKTTAPRTWHPRNRCTTDHQKLKFCSDSSCSICSSSSVHSGLFDGGGSFSGGGFLGAVDIELRFWGGKGNGSGFSRGSCGVEGGDICCRDRSRFVSSRSIFLLSGGLVG